MYFLLGSMELHFGGNPVACAAGLVVLEEIFDNELLKNVYELGIYFKSRLIDIKINFQIK
jgi:Ornithine/acetylornithine aminotransferase